MSTIAQNSKQQCPLCGEANICAISTGKTIEECWCHSVSISDARLNDIPQPDKFQRCLCRACAEKTGELNLGR
ncbi:MAG: cysteine-rich CWC family protein [Proteobacteria bacterium]|nr:cysteine-rich CWC family protein [Pseudomonadota bacterium]